MTTKSACHSPLVQAAEAYVDGMEPLEAIPANEARACLQNAFFNGAWFAGKGDVTERERERCARLCDELAEFMERGAGERQPGHRLRQAARNIREGHSPIDMKAAGLIGAVAGAQFKQPHWGHVMQAFKDGAREARANQDATDADFGRAADGYTKRVFAEVDPAGDLFLNGPAAVGPSASPAPSIERAMRLADLYVIEASGDTATARHQYSTARASLRKYLQEAFGEKEAT